eukprot:g38976.t1
MRGDYAVLAGAPSALPSPSIPRRVTGVAGRMVLLALSGWLGRGLVQFSSAPQPLEDHTVTPAFLPRTSMEEVIVRPGPPSPLQAGGALVFSPKTQPSALFLYMENVPKEFAYGATMQKGHIYGARLQDENKPRHPFQHVLAYRTGSAEDVLKGQVLTMSEKMLADKLIRADREAKLWAFDFTDPSLEHESAVKRGTAQVVLENGNTILAWWYYLSDHVMKQKETRHLSDDRIVPLHAHLFLPGSGRPISSPLRLSPLSLKHLSPSFPRPVVLLHGLDSSKHSFADFGLELARRGMLVLALDLRGSGETGLGADPETNFRPRNLAADVRACARKWFLPLGLSSSYVLLGHSCGARIALR